MTLTERTRNKFAHINKVVTTESFLKMDALGGEIPFWIAPYEIEAEDQVQTEITNLSKRLKNDGVKPLVINLFELSCEIIDEHIGLDKMFTVEKKKNKEKFKRAIQSTINVHERLIPAIVDKIKAESPQLLFITGVASVYPFIRSHTILNNLQSAVKEISTIMFFSGAYSGQSLNLFGQLKDDNYYRAFNIDNYKL